MLMILRELNAVEGMSAGVFYKSSCRNQTVYKVDMIVNVRSGKSFNKFGGKFGNVIHIGNFFIVVDDFKESHSACLRLVKLRNIFVKLASQFAYAGGLRGIFLGRYVFGNLGSFS